MIYIIIHQLAGICSQPKCIGGIIGATLLTTPISP